MRLGLRGRFVAFVSAIVIAFGVVLTALAVRVQNDRLRHELVERGKLLTTLVAANATDPMAMLKVGELRQMLAEIRHQENVIEAVVFDEDGRVLTDGSVENPLRHQLIDATQLRHVAVSDSLLAEFAAGVMTVTQPVRLGARSLGGIRLRYSLAGLAEEQALLARRTTMVGVVFATLGVLAAALLTEAVTRPLREVIQATHVIASGESPPPLPVRTSDEVGELAASFNEMTRRLRATTVSRDYLDRVLGTMGECLVVCGLDGTISRVNKAACRLAGATEEELIGRRCEEVFRPPEGRRTLFEGLSPDSSLFGMETEILAKNGEPIPVMASVAEMSGAGGSPQGYVVVAGDLRERLRIERQKDEFVTMVNHELRAPLTAVRGALGLLSGGVAGNLGDHAGELLEIAMRNSRRLERLIDDILANQKLESGRMEFRFDEVELKPLLEQALESMATYREDYEVEFSLDAEPAGARVRVDSDRLIQVVTNVLMNAAGFSPAGETVAVTVGRHKGLLRIAVADRGPGIPEDFRDKVFEKFARVDPADSRRRGGTGLGLSISKAIMGEIGGDISFETEVGVGTTFFIDLPEVV